LAFRARFRRRTCAARFASPPAPRGRKSAGALTRDILERLIAACSGGRLADRRDAAPCFSPSLPAATAARRSPA
jgi:hypothetical protein